MKQENTIKETKTIRYFTKHQLGLMRANTKGLKLTVNNAVRMGFVEYKKNTEDTDIISELFIQLPAQEGQSPQFLILAMERDYTHNQMIQLIKASPITRKNEEDEDETVMNQHTVYFGICETTKEFCKILLDTAVEKFVYNPITQPDQQVITEEHGK